MLSAQRLVCSQSTVQTKQVSDNFTQVLRPHKGAGVIPEVGLCVRPACVVGDSMLVLFSFSSQSCYGRLETCRLPATRGSVRHLTDPTLQKVCGKQRWKKYSGVLLK